MALTNGRKNTSFVMDPHEFARGGLSIGSLFPQVVAQVSIPMCTCSVAAVDVPASKARPAGLP